MEAFLEPLYGLVFSCVLFVLGALLCMLRALRFNGKCVLAVTWSLSFDPVLSRRKYMLLCSTCTPAHALFLFVWGGWAVDFGLTCA